MIFVITVVVWFVVAFYFITVSINTVWTLFLAYRYMYSVNTSVRVM